MGSRGAVSITGLSRLNLTRDPGDQEGLEWEGLGAVLRMGPQVSETPVRSQGSLGVGNTGCKHGSLQRR